MKNISKNVIATEKSSENLHFNNGLLPDSQLFLIKTTSNAGSH